MRRLTVRALIFIASSAFVAALSAEPIVLFDPSNPPFMYEREGVVAGIYPSILSEAYARMGTAVTLRAIPWKRALLDVAAARSGIGGVYRNSSRDSEWDFSNPIYEEKTMLYVLPGGDFKLDSLADLRGKKIGVIRGWQYGDVFGAAVREGLFFVEEENSDILNFRKLVAGRIDAVLAIKESGDLYSGFMNAGIHHLPFVLTAKFTYLAFNKKSGMRDELAAFNSALDSMKRDGTFDRLLKTAMSH